MQCGIVIYCIGKGFLANLAFAINEVIVVCLAGIEMDSMSSAIKNRIL